MAESPGQLAFSPKPVLFSCAPPCLIGSTALGTFGKKIRPLALGRISQPEYYWRKASEGLEHTIHKLSGKGEFRRVVENREFSEDSLLNLEARRVHQPLVFLQVTQPPWRAHARTHVCKHTHVSLLQERKSMAAKKEPFEPPTG